MQIRVPCPNFGLWKWWAEKGWYLRGNLEESVIMGGPVGCLHRSHETECSPGFLWTRQKVLGRAPYWDQHWGTVDRAAREELQPSAEDSGSHRWSGWREILWLHFPPSLYSPSLQISPRLILTRSQSTGDLCGCVPPSTEQGWWEESGSRDKQGVPNTPCLLFLSTFSPSHWPS